ncbi:MFS transporter [Pandoraea sp.]|uniref:MFS transporter n=1 Tax=Pandoraea sp. TaxID=1883445 RepID=UPI0025D6C108|nr:MFS transporter [Pandoraea sp.]
MKSNPMIAAPASCPEASPAPGALALVVLLTGAFLSPLDYFIVNLALPAIQGGLHASAAQLQMIVSLYTSAFAVLLVTGGRLGDQFGRKRMFMTGMAGFVAASLLCACAPNGAVLVAGRILQGGSAAVMVPQILATIRAVFPKAQQTRVMSLYGFVFGFASVVGQIGGGALITLRPFGLGWQSIFLINVPVGLLALLGAWRVVPENRPDHGARLDLGGLFFLLLSLALVIYPLTAGREAGWPAWTLVAFAASVPAFAVFVWVEAKLKRQGGDPLVDLGMFRNPVFSLGLVLAFCFYCDSAFFLTYGVYLQDGLHWSPLVAGLAIFPFGVGSIIGPLNSPRIVRHAGHHVLTIGFGLLATGFAFAIGMLWYRTTPSLVFYLGLLVAGVGHGLVLPSVVRVVIGEIEPARAGLASGVVTSMLQIGSAFGATAIGGVFFSALSHGAGALVYARAFQAGMGIVVVLFAACTLLAFVLVRQHALAGQRAGAQ